MVVVPAHATAVPAPVQSQPTWGRLFVALAWFCAIFALAHARYTSVGGTDFAWLYAGTLRLVEGNDPYALRLSVWNLAPMPLFYPLPALFFVVPFVWLSPAAAAAAWFALPVALLVYCAWGRPVLAVLGSPMFLMILGAHQHGILMLLAASSPAMVWLVWSKPQLGLLVLAWWAIQQQWRILGWSVLVCISIGLLAFVVQPNWLAGWLHNLSLAVGEQGFYLSRWEGAEPVQAHRMTHTAPVLLPGGWVVAGGLLLLLAWKRAVLLAAGGFCSICCCPLPVPCMTPCSSSWCPVRGMGRCSSLL